MLLINRLRIERVELKLEPASCVNFSNCLRWNRSEDRKKKKNDYGQHHDHFRVSQNSAKVKPKCLTNLEHFLSNVKISKADKHD